MYDRQQDSLKKRSRLLPATGYASCELEEHQSIDEQPEREALDVLLQALREALAATGSV